MQQTKNHKTTILPNKPLAFIIFLVLLLGTALLFRRAGWGKALALGVMASQRNMGLMLAATEGVLPGGTWLYFAVSQFPIYLSPLFVRAVVSCDKRTRVETEGTPR
jgi:BASS family bile acid:Na+ symporter